ncbi:MAG: hypothetical protein AB8H47_12585 [Bacteroidia bacterium]
MNLEEYQQAWQAQALPKLDETTLLQKTEGLAAGIAKQSRKVVFTLGGTVIYLIVIGGIFLRDNLLALGLVGFVVLLLIYQAVLLHRRNFSVERSLEAEPTQYLEQVIQKLRYNLQVSRIHMPIYGILLGSLISVYTWVVLGPTPDWIKALAVGGTLLFIVVIFVWGMRRQYRKDKAQIIPLLEDLEAMKASYSSL